MRWLQRCDGAGRGRDLKASGIQWASRVAKHASKLKGPLHNRLQVAGGPAR